MTKHSRRRGRRYAAAAVVASCSTALALGPAVGSAAAADPDCGPAAMTQPLVDHIDSAHLERSPYGQVTDLMNVDAYTLAHTVLAENMLAPLLPTLMGTVTPFVDHVDSAHLERSPVQQVKDLLDINDYVLAHTVLVESMLAPELSDTGCVGGDDTPAPMAAMPGMSAPAAPAPAAGAPAPAAGHAMSANVVMSGLAFSPTALTVPVGATVTWTNQDDAPHTVTSKGNGGLRSKTLQKGDTYSHMFMSAGTFTYYCTVHPNMVATVTVQ